MTEPASPQLSLSTTDVDCDNSRPEAVSPSSPSACGDGSSAGGQIAWSSGVQDLLNRTGFQLRQENGQRRYGGPPPDWTGPVPSRGCEVFVGKLPRDCYEDELVPVFEKFGRIYELRLMMEFSGATRGYCFVTYSTRSEARRAIREADDLEIRPGRRIGVCSSVDNCRLFVGGLPRHRRREEILVEMRRLAEGVRDVIVYPDARDKSRNRGFAFVEFSSHSEAAKARRNLINGNGTQLWGQTLAIDWAEPEPEPDDDVMNKVKILYVRNLMLDTSEETLERVFTDAVLGVTGQPSDITNGSISAPTGSTSDQRSQNVIERVKKIRDYAFVHFRDREEALIAMQRMNGMEIDGSQIEVCLAKPADKTRQRQSRNKMPSTSDPAVLQGTNVQILGAVGGMLVPTQIPTIQATSAGLVTKDQLQQPKSLKSRSSLGAATVSAMRASFLPYKKPSPTTEGRLYGYYMPAVDVLYGNPTVLVQPQTQTASQALYDLCAVNGYGTPLYQVFTTVSDGVQMYLYKLTVAGREFLVSNLSPTPEEAQNSVTMLALKTLTKVPLANLPQRIISPPVSGWPVPMNVAANMCGPVGASAATVATSDGSGLLAPAPMDPYHLLTGFGAVSGLVPPGAILTPAAADVSGLLGNGAIPIQAAAASQLMMGAPTPTVAALPTFMTSSIDGAATSAQLQSAPCFNTFAGYVS